MENKIVKIVVISPVSKYIVGTTNTPFIDEETEAQWGKGTSYWSANYNLAKLGKVSVTCNLKNDLIWNESVQIPVSQDG